MNVIFNIIGAGHVGRVLGRLLAGVEGIAVQDVLTRSMESARDAVDFIGAGTPVDTYAALRRADVTMLAVSDDQIVPACAALVAEGGQGGAIVFHCSGALASSLLLAATQAGASVASVHPIRSFADPGQVAGSFDGTYCGIEGDPLALAFLTPALTAIGARPVPIAAAKTLYHSAAVFASNYLVTVLDASLRAYQAAGIPEAVARELAGPLVTETVANVLRLGAAPALTGPIARGDMATVARQQQAVAQWDAATGDLYAALVAPTVDLARRKRGQ